MLTISGHCNCSIFNYPRDSSEPWNALDIRYFVCLIRYFTTSKTEKKKFTLSSWRCKQFNGYVNKQNYDYDAKWKYEPISMNIFQIWTEWKKKK